MTFRTFMMPALLAGGVLLLSPNFAPSAEASTNGAQPFAAATVNKKADRLWRAKCASCHGRDGKGATEQGKKMKIVDMSTAKWQSSFSDEKIKKTLNEGVSRTKDGVKQEMESFKKKLSDKKVALLIERIRAFAP